MGGEKVLLESGDSIKDNYIDDVPLGPSQDAYKLIGSNILVRGSITVDQCDRTEPHCDDMQLIPCKSYMRYFGEVASGIEIVGGSLDSDGTMQGVFSADGGYRETIIRDREITTKSDHKCTLSGVLDNCVITNLRDKSGDPARILLDSLRIGGGATGHFFVKSFKKNTEYQYGPVITDQVIDDRRGIAWRNGHDYVDNFDLGLWQSIARKLSYDDVESHLINCKAEYERLKDMHISEDQLVIGNYLLMTDAELIQWADRWPNFKPYEIASRDFSIIVNTKSLDALQSLRLDWGKSLHVNSAYRTPSHNRAVGGKPNSDHLKGSAFDIHINSISMGKKLEKLAIKHGFNAIGRYRRSMFIHISQRDKKPNGRIYQWGRW